ncbi:4a-hydroxytetrahydrobiopterin dehydratase [Acrocarpospora catenulata]|uniref:4a-hydroxytetrahydrobiopterin dehydratase n=1 Tax=Acrocarpospora catenulata TaxID=2836182 RepID=UPI001BDAE9CC|nr:4a-hydroxytetrahydrobiopterin dehydratase [Acrocarpospora catenulata]
MGTDKPEPAAWTREGETLRRTLTAPDFRTGIAIVDAVAEEAERMNHHPDIDIRWCTLHFLLTTHDTGTLTDSDYTLAKHIDRIADEHGAK